VRLLAVVGAPTLAVVVAAPDGGLVPQVLTLVLGLITAALVTRTARRGRRR
jgi:hypothetical protein